MLTSGIEPLASFHYLISFFYTNTQIHRILAQSIFGQTLITSLYHKDTEKADLSKIVCFLYGLTMNDLLNQQYLKRL